MHTVKKHGTDVTLTIPITNLVSKSSVKNKNQASSTFQESNE